MDGTAYGQDLPRFGRGLAQRRLGAGACLGREDSGTREVHQAAGSAGTGGGRFQARLG